MTVLKQTYNLRSRAYVQSKGWLGRRTDNRPIVETEIGGNWLTTDTEKEKEEEKSKQNGKTS